MADFAHMWSRGLSFLPADTELITIYTSTAYGRGPNRQPLWELGVSQLLQSGICPELRHLVWSLKLKLLTCCSLHILEQGANRASRACGLGLDSLGSSLGFSWYPWAGHASAKLS